MSENTKKIKETCCEKCVHKHWQSKTLVCRNLDCPDCHKPQEENLEWQGGNKKSPTCICKTPLHTECRGCDCWWHSSSPDKMVEGELDKALENIASAKLTNEEVQERINRTREVEQEEWEKEFDEEFTREDGLINKYSFYPDGEEKSTPDALKLFITKVLSSARKEEREKLIEKIEKLTGFTSIIDKKYQTGFNTCRKEIINLISNL